MLTRIQKAFQKALYPDKCLVCGHFFHAGERFKPAFSYNEYFHGTPIKIIYQKEISAYFCPVCIGEFHAITPPFCHQCGKVFKSPVSDSHFCGDCIQKNKPFQRVRSAGIYNGSLMEAIHQLKYSGKTQFAKPLGRVLFGSFLNYFLDVNIDLIIPVPLHASKLRSRGFNQVILMLTEWPALAAKALSSFPTIDYQGKMIARKKKTESQTGLGKEKRKSNVKGAFSVLLPESIHGKQVLLVDDVYTTGATTEECTNALINHGARNVHILTLARSR
jgi:ComF family protein